MRSRASAVCFSSSSELLVRRAERLVGRWRCVKVPILDCGRKGNQLELFVGALSNHAQHLLNAADPHSSSGKKIDCIPELGFIPDTLGFSSDVLGCDSQRHLCVYRAAFMKPDVLRAGPARSPCECWAKLQGTRRGLLTIFAKWHAVGRFGVVPSENLRTCDVAQIVAITKGPDKDRQIPHQRRLHSVEDRLYESALKHLRGDPLLVDLPLRPLERLCLAGRERGSPTITNFACRRVGCVAHR